MDERGRFVKAFLSGAFTMSELCRSAGVSRPTGYLWVDRYLKEGEAGLGGRSHAPHACPHRAPEALREALLELRREHPCWGPRKLLALARRARPQAPWPGRSTVAEWLRREGLVQRPRRASRPPPTAGQSARTPSAPNRLWTIDFKGEFRTGDRRYCYPLTVTDLASRFLLAVQGQRSPSGGPVTACTETLFREHGLPEAIHCDGGSPFTGRGLGRYSHVSLRWLKLGIRIERSRRACPQDNASHERMHRTLKAATQRPPAADLRCQQRLFDRFRHEFNHERPHEALGDHTPAEYYRDSSRRCPPRLPAPSYPGHFELRRVSHGGWFKWRSRSVFLGSVFAGELIGLEEIDDGVWSVYFARHLLARFDEQLGRLIEVPV
jgi:transposase InsO family protein